MTQIDPRALRNAFGTFLTGVTVVTSHNRTGQPIGFTANSFTSVSLDPPLVLVCLAHSSSNHDALVSAPGFAVNILAETQVELSNTFARPVADRFANVTWEPGPNGSPLLDGVSAWFDCAMHKTVDAGDHVILIGEVKAFGSSATPGLGYANGAYVTPGATAEALARHSNLIVSALIEHDGKVLLVEDPNGGVTLPERPVSREGSTAAVQNLIEACGISAQPGFVYSVYEDSREKSQHIVFLCHADDAAPSRGTFTTLTPDILAKVKNPAMQTMLERFANETAIGAFGIYVGNENSGQVRPIT